MANIKKRVTLNDIADAVNGVSIRVNDLTGKVNGVSQGLDNLALLTKKSFDDLEKRIDERFKEVDESLGNLDQGQEQIKNILRSEMERLNGHDDRIKNLELKITPQSN